MYDHHEDVMLAFIEFRTVLNRTSRQGRFFVLRIFLGGAIFRSEASALSPFSCAVRPGATTTRLAFTDHATTSSPNSPTISPAATMTLAGLAVDATKAAPIPLCRGPTLPGPRRHCRGEKSKGGAAPLTFEIKLMKNLPRRTL